MASPLEGMKISFPYLRVLIEGIEWVNLEGNNYSSIFSQNLKFSFSQNYEKLDLINLN